MTCSLIHRALRTTALTLLAVLGFASIIATGGSSTAPGEEGGETRRFDQYPELLAVAGNGVIVAGGRTALTIVADGNQYRRNFDVSYEQTYGVDVSRGISQSVEVFDQRPELNTRNGVQDFYYAAVDLAGVTGSATVQRTVLTFSNPRSSITRPVFVVPEGRNYLAEFTVNRKILNTGASAEGVLRLGSPAPPGGAVVTLQVNSPVLTLPATVTVPAGASEARFEMVGNIDSLQQYAVITAAYNEVEQQAGLWVRSTNPFLLRLEFPERLTPEGATEPTPVQGKVILSAPSVGTLTALRLESNNSLVTFPDALPAVRGGVAIPVAAGATEVTFDMLVAPLFELGVVRISAELLRDNSAGTQSINSLVADAHFGSSTIAELRSVSFQEFLPNGNSLGGGGSCLHAWRGDHAEVTVTLSKPAPADYRMEMYAGSPTVLSLSSQFTIPEGQSEVRFRMDYVPGGPPETCTQVGPFCTSIGNYQRPDANVWRFTKLFVRALRTGKTLSFDRWVAYRREPQSPFIDPFVIHSTSHAGGSNVSGELGVQTDNHYDDLPITVRLANGQSQSVVWPAEYQPTDRVGFSIPTPAVTEDTPTSVFASSAIDCLAGRGETEDDPAVTRTRSFTLTPAPLLSSVSVDKPAVFGGESAQLTIHLGRPAGSGGLQVALQPVFPNPRLHLPASVLVPEGSDSAVVTLSTDPVDVETNVLIDAIADGATRTVTIIVLREPLFVRLTATPSAVTSGQRLILTATSDRHYPLPLNVALSSSSAAVPVPTGLILTPNENGPNEASWAVTTAAVGTPTSVQVTATLRGQVDTAFITVQPATGPAPPGIEYQPQGVAVAVGAAATFTVVATGGAPLTYQWQRGGANIPGANSASYTTPPAVATDDGAVFRVIISNAAGSITSQNAVLTVGGGWRALGVLPVAQSVSVQLPSLAVASDGTRYVSYVELSGGDRKLFVKRFDGTAWVTVGGTAVAGDTSSEALENTILVGADDLPVVAWIDGPRVRVARWNGTQWNLLADDLSVDASDQLGAQYVQMERAGNALVVAWIEPLIDPSPQQRLAVKRFDPVAATWSGGYVPDLFNAADIRLALDSQGYPAIAYVPRNDLAGGTGVGAIHVIRQSATGWSPLGGDVGPVPVANSSGFTGIYGLGIKFDATDAPIVFGSANGTSLYAFRHAAGWQPLTGTDGVFVTLDPATELSTRMAFTRGGPQIALAYHRQQLAGVGLNFRTEFLQWNGVSWTPLATPLAGSFDAMSPALMPNGQPILAYRNGFAISVQQFGP
jgi:hypothetical protein